MTMNAIDMLFRRYKYHTVGTLKRHTFYHTRGEHVHHYTTDYARTDAKIAHSPHDRFNGLDHKSEQKKDIIKHNQHRAPPSPSVEVK